MAIPIETRKKVDVLLMKFHLRNGKPPKGKGHAGVKGASHTGI
jgi:hypothetical protein